MGLPAIKPPQYFPAPAIVEAAAHVFGVTVDQLRGGGKGPSFVLARHGAAALLRTWTAMSNGEISVALGIHRDGGRYNVVKGLDLQRSNPRFAQALDDAYQRLVEGLHG